jgi:hypothetical protein
MTEPLVPVWSDEQRRAFLKAPVAFAHGLAASGLVEDDALVRLLDRYPADMFDINAYSYDEEGQVALRTGARGRASGAEVLEGIKAGRLWVNLRRADLHYPELGEEVRRAFEDIQEEVPGFRPVDIYGQLILSSPANKVPYHADPAGVVLFHLRGRKRIWIYPVDEQHLPQPAMEKVVMKQSTEELPYRMSMDAAAEVFDLEPGMALAWPIHAPHRVENLDTFNVSFSADYQTWDSRLSNGAYVAAGVFRRWGLPVPAVERAPKPALAGLWACGAAMKRAGLVKSRLAGFERTFELGAEAA